MGREGTGGVAAGSLSYPPGGCRCFVPGGESAECRASSLNPALVAPPPRSSKNYGLNVPACLARLKNCTDNKHQSQCLPEFSASSAALSNQDTKTLRIRTASPTRQAH